MDEMRRFGMALHDTEEYEGHLLHQAAIFDSESLLQDLLSGEAVHSINAFDPLHRTALYLCVTRNSLRCAKLLLEHGGQCYLILYLNMLNYLLNINFFLFKCNLADCNLKSGEQCDYTVCILAALFCVCFFLT